MVDFSGTISPYLEKGREVIMWVAEKIANAFTLNIENVYMVLLIIISVWAGKKIFDFFYSNTEGRWGYWITISAAIFLILKYFGLN